MSIFKIYDNASAVASLWCLSPILVIAALHKDDEAFWLQPLCVFLLIIISISLAKFRKKKILDNSWGYSDLLVYILIPIALCTFIGFAILSSNV